VHPDYTTALAHPPEWCAAHGTKAAFVLQTSDGRHVSVSTELSLRSSGYAELLLVTPKLSGAPSLPTRFVDAKTLHEAFAAL
jgi:hypothetical protein